MQVDPGKVDVWLLDQTNVGPSGLDRHLAAADVCHAHRARKRSGWAARRAACRLIIRQYLPADESELPISVTEGGKPQLEGGTSGLAFSVACSGKVVAVAIALEPVGIDVQEIAGGWNLEEMTSVFLNQVETRELHLAPSDEQRGRFVSAWAMKEAVAKLDGRGMGLPFKSIGTAKEQSSAAPINAPGSNDRRPTLCTVPFGIATEYEGAVAKYGLGWQLRWRDASKASSLRTAGLGALAAAITQGRLRRAHIEAPCGVEAGAY